MPQTHPIGLLIAALAVFEPDAGLAQSAVTTETCSAHFQARANWLEDLAGPSSTQTYMRMRAEDLWYSVPRDCSMHTGFGNPGCRYEPNNDRVLSIMTDWAEVSLGFEPRPVCMEDPFCSRCITLYNKVYP
ncbi:MAG: hypothetical protein AAF641_12975 [Pseudomonadota bacterium]